MRLITPSFTGQGFGALDLNAVAPGTSPAFTFQREHLSGSEYAEYLHLLARHFQLPLAEGTAVRKLHKDKDGFLVETDQGVLKARSVIWGTGSSSFPSILFRAQNLDCITAKSPHGVNLKQPIIMWSAVMKAQWTPLFSSQSMEVM